MSNFQNITTMKKMMMIMAMMVTIATRAAAMSYTEARAEALFLTDKMAYELNLTSMQYEAVYEINFDYLAALSYEDVFGSNWAYRNSCLRHVLDGWQYNKYMAANYFYRPVSWTNNRWHFGIYSRYNNRNHFYRLQPNAYANYRGHVGRGPRTNNHGHGNLGARPTTPNSRNHGHVGTHTTTPNRPIGTTASRPGNTRQHTANNGTAGRFGTHR